MEKYVLWLPGWYPTKQSPFEGDFIQRHARAASLYRKIIVVFVKKEINGNKAGSYNIIRRSEGNLTEIICTYTPFSSGMSFLDKAISYFTYQRHLKKLIREVIATNGIPLAIHTHVIARNAGISLYLKRKLKIPLIISEHWSVFLQASTDEFRKINFLIRRKWKAAFQAADKITVVSDVLGKGLQYNMKTAGYIIIPNVVDTRIFYPSASQSADVVNFLHISLGGPHKNLPGILKAFAILNNKNIDFRLHLVLPDRNQMDALAREYDVAEKLIYHPEVPQEELAMIMRQADALVLYSQYETFGCVVIEANATGIPAILSDLPVFREYGIEKKTCLFAEPNQPDKLAMVILNFINKKQDFDKKEIAEITTSRFSMEVVGKQFNDQYDSLY